MQRSEQIGELVSALAKAQSEYTPVQKKKTARVKSQRTGAEFTYNYADLADCLSMALPLLSKNGIFFSQPHIIMDGKLRVVTMLAHSSGQWMQSDGIEISEEGDPQQFGAESTYFRRYDGCSFIGVAPDEDTDAQAAGERTRKVTPAEVMGPVVSPKQQRTPEPHIPASHPAPVADNGPWALADDLLTCVIKGVTPKETKAHKPYLTVVVNGRIDGFNYVFCYHGSLINALTEAVGKPVTLRIAPKMSDDKKSIQYFTVEDLIDVAGVQYKDGQADDLLTQLVAHD